METTDIYSLATRSFTHINNKSVVNVNTRAQTAYAGQTPRLQNDEQSAPLPRVAFAENYYVDDSHSAIKSTNRSLPANYGSTNLQPINPQNRNLVGNDPYTSYQSDRGNRAKFSVYRDAKGAHAQRGANSAPSIKKPDKARPLPRINNLVKGFNDPDPLERHLRKKPPAGQSTYKNGQSGTSTKAPKAFDTNEAGPTEHDTTASHAPTVKHSDTSGKTAPNAASQKPSPYRGNLNNTASSNASEIKENIVDPPKTSRTIYFGPNTTARSKSRLQEDRDNHIQRQLLGGGGTNYNKNGPSMQKRGTSLYKSRGDDDLNTTYTFRSDRENTKSVIAPRRERTRANVTRARSELISKAKTKDDVRLRRTRNFVAVPVDNTHHKKEKVERDIYKLEEQMRIYLAMQGINMNGDEFDAETKTNASFATNATSRVGSPKKRKANNPYLDSKSSVPPWHRKEYVLNEREADMYKNISKVYGNEKLRRNRENAFYKKVEALQLEQWHRLWDEYERKLRERDNNRKKHLGQLKNVREKYNDDRWERIAKFPVNRIPVQGEKTRHEYGLPSDLNEDPDTYIPRVGATHKPKDTFNSETQNMKNVKRWDPIFRGYRKVNNNLKHLKMEGVDVVTLDDEETATQYGPDGKRIKKKRVKVTSLVKDAEDALEGASDDSEWEDVEDAEELNRRLRKTPAPIDHNMANNSYNSPRDPKYSKKPQPNQKYGAYGTKVEPKRATAAETNKSNLFGTKSRQPNTNVPSKSTENAYRPKAHNKFKSNIGDFRSGAGDLKKSKTTSKIDDDVDQHNVIGDESSKQNDESDTKIVGDNADGDHSLKQNGDKLVESGDSSVNNTPNGVQNSNNKTGDSDSSKDKIPKNGEGVSSVEKDNKGDENKNKGSESSKLNDNNTQDGLDKAGNNINTQDTTSQNLENQSKSEIGDNKGINNQKLPVTSEENKKKAASTVPSSTTTKTTKETSTTKGKEANETSPQDQGLKSSESDNTSKDKESSGDNSDGSGFNANKNSANKEDDDKASTGNKKDGENTIDITNGPSDQSKSNKRGDKSENGDFNSNSNSHFDRKAGLNENNEPATNGSLEHNNEGQAKNDNSQKGDNPKTKSSMKSTSESKSNSNSGKPDEKQVNGEIGHDTSGEKTSQEGDKENHAPKKHVRIVSPEKQHSKAPTRAVSPGVGKNRGGYKAPKKFEVQKSDKESTRAESPSLFQKGLYHEPNKFQVKKSDKELTKSQGPDLGHGEYEAPEPFEITKTERTIKGKSPFSERERGIYTPGSPESHKRRTGRTEIVERAVEERKPRTQRTSVVKPREDEYDQQRPRKNQRNTESRERIDHSKPSGPVENGAPQRRKLIRKETTTETKTIRRRKPGNNDDDDDDDEYNTTVQKPTRPRQTRKSSPAKRRESKAKGKPTAVSQQDPGRPDIPTPDLDTDDDDDDIFERAKRKYGIVLDDSD